MHMILPGLYTLSGPYIGRVYLMRDDEGCTVIDTSIAPAAGAILAQARVLGYQAADIRRIMITHAHPDHIGGLAALKQASGATVLAARLERPVIEGTIPVPRPLAATLDPLSRALRPPPSTFSGVGVERELRDGDLIHSGLGDLRVVATPGHTPGHLAFWAVEQGVLFCGDAIMHLFGRLSLPIAAFTFDMAENLRSIAHIANLAPEVVCFGHGPVLSRQTTRRIRVFARRIGAL